MPPLKGQWDRIVRKGCRIHVVATGSSSLRIGQGSRESRAGRFERLTLTHWSSAALATVFKLRPEIAAELSVRFGSYPGAFPLRKDPVRWGAYVRDSILEPALSKDILALTDVRRPALLRQVFAVAATSPAQILSLQKIQRQIQDRGALETIAHYLQILQDAYLVAGLEKHGPTALRQRAAPPKIVVLNNAILGAVQQRGPLDRTRDPDRLGFWIENACLAFAWNSGQGVTYWREEPLEVDGVIDGSWGSYAIEVKTGAFQLSDLKGLFEFSRRHPKFKPLLLCDREKVAFAGRLGVPAMDWKTFLLSGPAGKP